MLSDEEKEAIEWLKRLVKINKRDNLDNTFAEILLNLIEKQSKEKKDILFQIDMQLYDEFNNKFCEMNDNLGDTYTYKDLEELTQAEKDKEIKLLRKAIKELESNNYECNNIIREYIEDWRLKTKMIELMAEHLTTPIHSKKDVVEYFENLAKESGEINEG